MSKLTQQDEIRLLTYLRPDPVAGRSWVETEPHDDSDEQRQFDTKLPLDNHRQEAGLLAAYLKDNLGISLVQPSERLTAGQFYMKPIITDQVARMADLDTMPYQLLFHKDDKQRVEDFVESHTQELRAAGVQVDKPKGGAKR